MKKNILLDHLLIAVSKEEFEYWKEKSNVLDFVYSTKKDLEKGSHDACYIRANSLFYLEIVEEANYPGRIGLSFVDLSEENNLFDYLKLKYPNWNFQEEKTYSLGEHWYSAYFSKETESKISFTWFVEYKGKFLKERENDSKNKNNITFIIILSKEEYKDFIEIIKKFDFIIEESSYKTVIRDILGNYFTILIKDSPDKRIELVT